MNSVFIDSNVIIKYFQGDNAAKMVLQPVISSYIEGYINSIVFSEVMYFAIRIKTGLKPFDLKRNPKAVSDAIAAAKDQIGFIKQYFKELEINDEIKDLALQEMKDEGILPNDALIVATCKYYSVGTIITFDTDFKQVQGLGIIKKP